MRKYGIPSRLLAALLCLLMVVSCVPMNLLTVYAGGTTPAASLWTQVGEVDKSTGGAWQSVGGYGDALAVLFGWGDQAATNPTAGSIGRGAERNLYVIGGTTFSSGNNNYKEEFDNSDGHPGNVTITADPDGVANLEAPAGYTGTVPTFNAYMCGSKGGWWGSLSDFSATALNTLGGNFEGSKGVMYYDVNFGTGSALEDDKEYVLTLYADGGYSSTDYSGSVRFSFVSKDYTTLYGQVVVNAADFENGAYVSFLTKGAYKLIVEFGASPRLGISAAFFDEYVPEDDSDDSDTVDLWDQSGTIDTTTGGAWQTKGYGDELAVLFGWAQDTVTAVHGGQNHVGRGEDSNLYIAKGVVQAYSSTYGAMFNNSTFAPGNANISKTVPSSLEAPAGYTGAVPTYSTYERAYCGGTYTEGAHWNKVQAVNMTGYDGRMAYSVKPADETKEYIFSLYTDPSENTDGYTGNVRFTFINADGTQVYSQHVVDAAQFGTSGAYISFKVQGAFIVIIDHATAYKYFSVSAAFLSTQDPTQEPLWVQVGDMDTTTGGKWHSVGDYGDEQALLLGWKGAEGNNSQTFSYGGGTSAYKWTGSTCNGATLHTNTAADAIKMPDTGTAGQRLAQEYWHSSTLTANGVPTTPAILEAPAGYTGVVPNFNSYTAMGCDSASTISFYDKVPLSSGYTHRVLAQFNVPAEKADKEYYFTVYANTAGYVNTLDTTVELFFTDLEGNLLGEKLVVNTKDLGKNGGYLTFRVKGSFLLGMDKNSTAYNFGLSAFFFDEEAPATADPKPVIPAEDIWKLHSTDTETKGAWNTAGYGTYDALLLGYNKSIDFGTASSKYITISSAGGDQLSVNGRVSVSAIQNIEYWSKKADSATAEGLLYNPNTTHTPAFIYHFGGLTQNRNNDSAALANVPGASDLPVISWDTTINNSPWCREYITFTGLDADTVYEFSAYSDGKGPNFWPQDQEDLRIYLVEEDGTVHTVENLKSKEFKNKGTYRTWLVKGNFTLVVDKKNTAIDGSYDTGFGATFFGFSGFFFDEYVPEQNEPTSAPTTPTTPTTTPTTPTTTPTTPTTTPTTPTTTPTTAPTTPVAPPADLWQQVGDVDTTTHGQWQTKTDYGTEQAFIIGWRGVDGINANLDKYGGSSAYYRHYGATCNGATWRKDTSADAITFPDSASVNSKRLAHEYIYFRGRTATGVETNTPNLEIPAEFTGTLPMYNGYTAAGRPSDHADAEHFFFDKNPLSSDMAYRIVGTFNVPESKANTVYYFTVYADTLNFTGDLASEFELSITDLEGNPLGQKVRFNTADFGKNGGYVTFKVMGSFLLHFDKKSTDAKFGLSAFFFDEDKPDPEPPAPPVPDSADLWSQIGAIDNNTCGKWNSVTGYGSVQAILLGWGYPNAENKGAPEGGYSSRVGRLLNVGYIPRANESHLHVTNSSITADVATGTPGNNNVFPGASQAGTTDTKAWLEAPAGYTGVRPQYNTYAVDGWGADDANLKYKDVKAPADGMSFRHYIKFNGLEADKEYIFTFYADTRNFVGDPTGKVELTFLNGAGTEVKLAKTYDIADFTNAGGYVSFKVKGNFILVIDKSELYFGPSAFFFDAERPVAPSKPTENAGSLVPTDDPDMWTVSGSVDSATGGKWHSVGSYGDIQAMLIGWPYATQENNGIPDKEYKDYFSNGAAYPFYMNIDRFQNNILFVKDSTVKVKNVAGFPGNFWAFEGSTVAGTDRKVPVLEAPENYAGVVPQYNAYATEGWHAESAGDTLVYRDVVAPFAEASYRQYWPISGTNTAEAYTFTVYADTRNIKDLPTGTIVFSFLSADGKKLLGSYKTTAQEFAKTGSYISFKTQGDFILVIDKEDRYFGISAFFVDTYEKPAASGGSSATVDKDLWKQSGNIDNATGGAWQTAGYGSEQAILLGWAKADDVNPKVYAMKENGAYAQHRYQHHVINPNGASWSLRSDADAITFVDNSRWSYLMNGMLMMYKGMNKSGTATYKPVLEVPDTFTGKVPNYNVTMAPGYSKDDVKNFQFPDITIASDLNNRVAMKFVLPDPNQEYAFTMYADTLYAKYKVNDPIEFTFVSPDGTQELSRTRVLGSDFGKRGGYITFKVKGSFILLMDKQDVTQEDGSTSYFFGPSAFFFDKYEGPQFHADPSGGKDVIHFSNMVDGVGGIWRGRYGNVDAIFLGYGFTGEPKKNKYFNPYTEDYAYDYQLSNVVQMSAAGDQWFYTAASGKKILVNPNPDAHEDTMVVYAGGGVQNTNNKHAGGAMLEQADGTSRSMFSFKGMPEDKPYIFTFYACNMGFYDTSDPGMVTLSFIDVEGNLAYQETISSSLFDKGAYRSYVVNGGFTLLIDKAGGAGFFGPSAFFFDEVGTNFVSNLTAQAGEEARSVLLTWKETDPKIGAKVVIERRTEDSDWVEIADLNIKQGRYLDTKRDSGTKYYYRIYTRAGTSSSYITNAITYTVPSYNKTVLTLDKTVYSAKNVEELMTVSVTLKTADGKPCANMPVWLRLSFAEKEQVTPMIHEPEVRTDANGKATFTFNARYMGDVKISAFFRDDDANKYAHTVSEVADGYIGETTWTNAPVIYKISDAVTPGDLISINGYGFINEDMSKLQVVYAPHTSAEVPEKPVDNAKKLALVQMDDENGFYLVTRLPEDAEPGLYDIWVNNGYGWSEPTVLNQARPLHISDYIVWEGQSIILVGRGLQGSQFGFDSETSVRLIKDDKIYYPTLDKISPYSIYFTINKGTALGTYDVEVSNDGGMTWFGLESEQTLTVREVGNDPLNTGLAWMDEFVWDQKFDVTDYGADGTDKKGDTAAFSAALRACKEAGGGVVWIPNGQYYITSLDIPSYTIMMGEDSEKTLLTYCGRNRGICMLEGDTETKDEGHIGMANFKITLEMPQFRPDCFIWLGHEWKEPYLNDMTSRTAENMFVSGVHFDTGHLPAVNGIRGMGVVVLGREHFLLEDTYSDQWNGVMAANKFSQYAIIRDNHWVLDTGASHMGANYTFYLNNYLSGHFGEMEDWEYTMRRDTHGLCAQSDAYFEGNEVANVGTTEIGDVVNIHNDGETYLCEVMWDLLEGDVIASTENTVTILPRNGMLQNDVISNDYNRLSVTIHNGKGMGQLRYIEKIDASTGIITVDRPWDVLPDNTSQFSFMKPVEDVTLYNNKETNAAKGVYIFGNMFDTVVANHTCVDTEGIFVYASHVGSSMGRRVWVNYYTTIRDNSITGVSARTRYSNIAFGSQREIAKGEFYGVQNYAMEVRNNVLVGDPELTAQATFVNALGKGIRRTEGAKQTGIVSTTSGSYKSTDNEDGDHTNIIIEDNRLQDMKNGITYDVGNDGIVSENNQFINVENPYNDDKTRRVDQDAVCDSLVIINTTDAKSIETQLAIYKNVDPDHYCADSVKALEEAVATVEALPANADANAMADAIRGAKKAYTALYLHTYDCGTVTKEASETKLGEMTYTCTNCGVTKVETISKLVAGGSALWIVILAVCCAGVIAVAAVTVVKAKKKKVTK